jgi:hypothetical protein
MNFMGHYDVAQICRNGHLITGYAESYPQDTKKFCPTCGEPTIRICESCNTPIQGEYHADHFGSIGREFPVPKYCHNCGKPYPWTELHIKAAKEAIDLLDELEKSEREELKSAVDDIARDTPAAKPAAYRIKGALGKMGKETQSMFRDILVDIASEVVVKIIMPK